MTKSRSNLSPRPTSRRDFFHLVSDGIYAAALTSLFCADVYGDPTTLRTGAEPAAGPAREHGLMPRKPHFEPKARSVIQLLMNGAPSQMDLFDPKPAIEKHRGESFVEKAATETTALADQRGLLP